MEAEVADERTTRKQSYWLHPKRHDAVQILGLDTRSSRPASGARTQTDFRKDPLADDTAVGPGSMAVVTDLHNRTVAFGD